MAGHRAARPQEPSLEPLTGTDGDETMMDNPGADDAGETSAVRSKIQPMKPSDQEMATHEACGHYPYRDWCRLCWWYLKSRTVCLWHAWITGSSLTVTTVSTQGEPHSVPDGENQAEFDDLEHACSMQRCGRPGSNQGDGRVAEQTWLSRADWQIGQ